MEIERVEVNEKQVQCINESLLKDEWLASTLINSDSISPTLHSKIPPDLSAQIKEIQGREVSKYKADIVSVIRNDDFEDGLISESEMYINKIYNNQAAQYIKEALMIIYQEYYDDIQMLTGVLEMISSRSYEEMFPQGQTMALGLLQHESLELRDRAIQTYEKWNSKKGIDVLGCLSCDQEWLQQYVDKVIFYLKQDGID